MSDPNDNRKVQTGPEHSGKLSFGEEARKLIHADSDSEPVLERTVEDLRTTPEEKIIKDTIREATAESNENIVYTDHPNIREGYAAPLQTLNTSSDHERYRYEQPQQTEPEYLTEREERPFYSYTDIRDENPTRAERPAGTSKVHTDTNGTERSENVESVPFRRSSKVSTVPPEYRNHQDQAQDRFQQIRTSRRQENAIRKELKQEAAELETADHETVLSEVSAEGSRGASSNARKNRIKNLNRGERGTLTHSDPRRKRLSHTTEKTSEQESATLRDKGITHTDKTGVTHSEQGRLNHTNSQGTGKVSADSYASGISYSDDTGLPAGNPQHHETNGSEAAVSKKGPDDKSVTVRPGSKKVSTTPVTLMNGRIISTDGDRDNERGRFLGSGNAKIPSLTLKLLKSDKIHLSEHDDESPITSKVSTLDRLRGSGKVSLRRPRSRKVSARPGSTVISAGKNVRKNRQAAAKAIEKRFDIQQDTDTSEASLEFEEREKR